MSRAVRLLVAVRDSFWFFALVCTVVAVVGVEALVWVDRAGLMGDTLLGTFLLEVGAEGSRGLLSAISTSMLGAAATTFSITVAVLALTSSTYGPRLVRNFLADRGNQFVLGYLVGTAIFALLVLRHVRVLDLESDDQPFVPHLATNVAVLLAIVGVGVLVYFLHHISVAIQVSSLSTRVRETLVGVVDRVYPQDQPAGHVRRGRPLVPPSGAAVEVVSQQSGYVQGVDGAALVRAAHESGALVELLVRPGSHLLPGEPLARLASATGTPVRDLEDLAERVRAAVALGGSRTPYQDVEFVVSQHVDLAVRAMSPAVNDPLTAMNALDDLSAGLALLAARPDPADALSDDDGVVRVRLAVVVDVRDLVVFVTDMLRVALSAHPVVAAHLVQSLARVARRAVDARTVRLVMEKIDLVVSQSEAALALEHDVRALRERAAELRTELAPRAAHLGDGAAGTP